MSNPKITPEEMELLDKLHRPAPPSLEMRLLAAMILFNRKDIPPHGMENLYLDEGKEALDLAERALKLIDKAAEDK